MDTSIFDKQIDKAKSEYSKLQSQMETVRQGFIEFTKSFVSEWSRKEIERYISSKPDFTKSLVIEKLRGLKLELNQLVERFPELVQTELMQDKYWPHRAETPTKASEIQGKTSEGIRDAIREFLGYCGELLFKYGFDEGGKDSSWERQTGKRPKYKYDYLLYSQEMDSHWKDYAELIDSLVKAKKKINKLEREKASYEAKNLWDQA